MTELDFFENPASVAVVGASEDPEKIGGRPLRYMREFGFTGRIFPVNPNRDTIQGLPAYPALEQTPGVPEVVVVAVAGHAAVRTVQAAADLGARGCIVMSAGFGETGTEHGGSGQAAMLDAARRSGMRLIGPNSQGLASFRSGAALGFSTLFTEDPPADGPVAIVGQSGAMMSVPYGVLRRRGIGVRYAHATGNDADVGAAELAASVIDDPELRLLLLYLENLGDPAHLVRLAEKSRRNGVPVVALVGGRSQSGSKAAASHTGALATERRVLDALFERIGIRRVASAQQWVASAELYLQDWRAEGANLAVVSNSGAVCVLAADAAEDAGLPLAELGEHTRKRLADELPAFASTANPVDVTAALLTDSSIFGRVLPLLAEDPAVHTCLLGIPVAGRGYDVERFAHDAAEFAASGTPLVLAVPQPGVARPFAAKGLPVFEDESAAVAALGQYLDHLGRMRRAEALPRPALGARRRGARTSLDEAASLERLAALGIPVVAHQHVARVDEVPAACGKLEAEASVGTERFVVKGLSAQTSHKSEFGLVRLGCAGAEQARSAAGQIAESATEHGIALDGFLVAPMIQGQHEVLIGANLDPVFGPVMVFGAGGVHVEAMPDTQVLPAPCTDWEVREAIRRLRIAALLDGVRGAPAADVDAWVKAIVRASTAFARADCPVAGFDANPVLLGASGEGILAVDAVVFETEP